MKYVNAYIHISIVFLTIVTSNILTAQNRKEVGNMILENVPEIPSDITSRIQQYQNTRYASFVDWLPNDNGMMIATQFGNTRQLHTVNTAGGSRNQITFFDEPVSNGSFSPSSAHNGFLFTKDMGGNEFSQLYWYDMNKRTYEMISDGTSLNFGVRWSNRGDTFAFTSSRRNNKDFDIYISDMKSPKTATLTIDRGNGYWTVSDWSPDDSKLLVTQFLSSTKSNSYIYDITTKELTQINDDTKEAVFLAKFWDKSGKKIYAITSQGKEFNMLVAYDIETKKLTYVTDKIAWNIDDVTLNSSRDMAAFTVNENGYSRLYLLNLESNSYEKISNLPLGQIDSFKFHPTNNLLAMSSRTAKTPGDVYVFDPKTKTSKRWTTSEVGGLDTSSFPEPELITCPTYDEVAGKKRMIPAFVYKPKNVKGPLPVVIAIHGGPEGQFTPSFSSFFTFLTNEMGIAIIAPNVRGSAGYGKTFLKLDNGFKREDSVKDIGKLIEWIEKTPEYDSTKIAVYGGSYGGYMVLSSMYNFGDKLKCGIDVVGISNFVTFLENTESYRRDLRRSEYGDERDPKMRAYLSSISPNNHVDKITKPLFIIQGANDPRVPASESEQMVTSIRENKGKVWYMLAKDEGHGFRKKVNRDRMTEAMAMFLQKNLLED
ncbi:S9 family peptidase [Aquimarina sp. W85]|uniref:S9 family peptidase n=1 Tax=Aquimarina rhodophyticola TaxID=3342246 RepID=UPI00366DDA9F